jgi:tetratricopeptide (TPR) repeat protein/cold shock CspA family protein
MEQMQNEEQVLAQAEVLASHGQWKEAAVLLQEYRAKGTPSMEALSKLAYYCSRAGDYDSAIALYQNLSQQQPSKGRWLYALGFQYQKKEQCQEAIAMYEHCLQLAPRWLQAALRLGDAYRATGQLEKAYEAYQKGIQHYHELTVARRSELVSIYAKLCGRAARMLLGKPNPRPEELEEALKLFQESVAADPNNADNWYRLACILLEKARLEEASECLQKAETLDPKKEYICHKIAQVHLRRGNPGEALKAYERIPHHRRAPYILHGMGQCYMAKSEAMEAAKKFHRAIQREPRKFYHHWDFALALIALGARDQAIEALEQTNQLFRQEYGKDYRKALAKLEEVRTTLPAGERISFEESSSAVPVISFGIVVKYDAKRGFGFIKDNTDGAEVFFHITRVKERMAPQIGSRARYVREVGERGLQAAKVWLPGE